MYMKPVKEWLKRCFQNARDFKRGMSVEPLDDWHSGFSKNVKILKNLRLFSLVSYYDTASRCDSYREKKRKTIMLNGNLQAIMPSA